MSMYKVAVIQIDRKGRYDNFVSESFAALLQDQIEWVEMSQEDYAHLLSAVSDNMLVLLDGETSVLSNIDQVLVDAKAWEEAQAEAAAKAKAKIDKRKSRGKAAGGLNAKQEQELNKLRKELGENHG